MVSLRKFLSFFLCHCLSWSHRKFPQKIYLFKSKTYDDMRTFPWHSVLIFQQQRWASAEKWCVTIFAVCVVLWRCWAANTLCITWYIVPMDFPRTRITVISNEFFALLSSPIDVFCTFWRLLELATVWRDYSVGREKKNRNMKQHMQQMKFTWDHR